METLRPTAWEWHKPYGSTREYLTRAASAETVVVTDPHEPPRDEDKRIIAHAPDMLLMLMEVARRIPDREGDEMVSGCAICDHDINWPEQYPTHKPDCRLNALLTQILGHEP